MAWIERPQSVFRHGKTRRAAGLLRISRIAMVGYLASLWCWAIDALPLAGGPVDAHDIALGADWSGDPDRLFQALASAGYLDQRRQGGRYYLHDWSKYAGKLHQSRVLARERKRRERSKNTRDTSQNDARNVTKRRVTERSKTKLNVTRDSHKNVTPTNLPTYQPTNQPTNLP